MKVSLIDWSILLSLAAVVTLLFSACAPSSTLPEQLPPTMPATGPMPDAVALELTASQYVEQGIALSRDGDYEQAIKDLTMAIEIDPVNAGAYYLRGSAYMGKQEYNMAIADLDKAVALGISWQDVPGLKEVIDTIIPPGELILLALTCTSEGGIDCQGNPKPYTNTLHLRLFINPVESGIEIDNIYFSPPISAKSQINSPIKYFHNTGIEHLVVCVSSTNPPTTPPICCIDYKQRGDLSFKRSNRIRCPEIEVGRLICPR
jgi:hypothetical protein